MSATYRLATAKGEVTAKPMKSKFGQSTSPMRRTSAIAETFQLFPIKRRVPARSRPIRDAYERPTSFGGRSEHAPEELIQFAGDAIDLRIPELAERTDRAIVLEGDMTFVILTQKHPDRRV